MRSKQLLSPVITDCTPGPGQLSGNMCFWSQGGPWEGVCVCVCECLYLCTSITVNEKSPLSSHPVEGLLVTYFFPMNSSLFLCMSQYFYKLDILDNMLLQPWILIASLVLRIFVVVLLV